MLYQLGESGSISAISSETLIFSGTETCADSSSSRALARPFCEYPKARPASLTSAWTSSRFCGATGEHLPELAGVEALGGESAYALIAFLGADEEAHRAADDPFLTAGPRSISQANRTAASQTTRDRLACEKTGIARPVQQPLRPVRRPVPGVLGDGPPVPRRQVAGQRVHVLPRLQPRLRPREARPQRPISADRSRTARRAPMLATAAALASFVLTSNTIARRLRPSHGNLPQPSHPTSAGTGSLPGALLSRLLTRGHPGQPL
jgi:hypothetical protein